MKYNVRKIDHRKEADISVHGVYLARYKFRKVRVVPSRQGEATEFPFEETVYLLRFPSSGEPRKVWLKSHEVRGLREALEELPSGTSCLGKARQMTLVGGEVQ
jgi:hypothetical protein